MKSWSRMGIGVLLVFSIVCVGVAGFNIVRWVIDDNSSKQVQEEVEEDATVAEVTDRNAENVNPPDDENDDYWEFIRTPLISVDFEKLRERNPDTVGWIKVNSTNINYPIVQAEDNEYYLTRAFDRSKNSAGWIFADYRNDMVDFDRNTVIYGHSRRNNTMFGTLTKVLKKSWYENRDNHVILLSTPTENTLWQVFSAYKIGPEGYYLTTEFASDEKFGSFVKTLQERSIYSFNTTVGDSDKLLTISTCADVAGKERIVLHAKLIKVQAR